MDVLTIEGGKRLKGEMVISGSKNAALPILIATLLTDETCVITNVPHLQDIEIVISLLVFLGKKIVRQGASVEISAGSTLNAEAPYELVRKMRGSIVVMGPLLARLGRVKASLPGGCAIGERPINIHLDGFRALGAQIRLDQGYVDVKGSSLKGADFHLDFPSVGATQNLMMAAALIPGKTTLSGVAREPENVDLAQFLTAMGARIDGAGTETITIQGVKRLSGAKHSVIPDRIETGTYMLASAITKGELTLKNTCPEHLETLIGLMRQAGIDVRVEKDRIAVPEASSFRSVDIETAVHPGMPTDLQAQWMALMTLAEGVSHISERVFENRFMHVAELRRLGAQIEIKGNTAIVQGVKSLSGAKVTVSDLRAGAALILAGLAAKDQTVIHRVYHLDRGYEHLEQKLSAVGARITRTEE